MSDYVELHVHSYYSYLDGLDSPSTLLQAAKDLGQTAMAITDHGTLSSHREFITSAEELGMKPIPGLEAYISSTDRFDKRDVKKRDDNTQVYNHITLLAQNAEGLENLNRMSEIAWREGYYYKPRIDVELLERFGSGIIVLSGCFNGLISKSIEREDFESARGWVEKLLDIAGENLYIEVQPHNTPEINHKLLEYADEFKIPAVVAGDCHYAYPQDKALEDAFLVLSTSPDVADGMDYNAVKGKSDLLDKLNELYPDRFMTFKDIDVFVSSMKGRYASMAEQGIERTDIYENTVRIAESVGSFSVERGVDLLPVVSDDPVAELEDRVWDGLRKLGILTQEYIDRATMEIATIRKKNFASYFLIVEDMVRWAKENKIYVGPGRGSAAGSLVCYSLGITDVDPLKYNLLFARFINEERNDFPDIDLDFEKSRRSDVKEYLRQKYGDVASIRTFAYFKGKNSVRDAARALRVPIADVNKVMKKIETFEDYMHSSNADWFRLKYPDVGPLAERLQGRVRQSGMHAGGVVISREPINKHAPIETDKEPGETDSKKRIPVVAYDMDTVADIGFIKFDILGLQTLSVIHEAVDLVEEQTGTRLNLRNLDLADPKVYEELGNGNTMGVFQCEAAPYTKLLKVMKPQNFEDLAASNALVRPGAMNTVGQTFINRMHGVERVVHEHDILEKITGDTYGVIIYQEQVMQAAVKLGGFTWSEADKLRKIIGKKKDVREFDQYRDKFVKNASKHVRPITAGTLWHDFEAHADYSFNRSHAVAYSILSYWTMWLKLNYPLEYMCAFMNNLEDLDRRTDAFIECKRLGLDVILPHVNRSDVRNTIEGKSLRLGLTNIKYISDKVAKNIVAKAPYKSFTELHQTAKERYSGINTRSLQYINKVGAATFDDNPLPEDFQEHLYDVMKIPKFNVVNLPDVVRNIITPLDEMDERGAFVILGMVKNIKKGKGWTLIDMVDESGSYSVFGNENTKIEEGNMYLAIVGDNSVVWSCPADDIQHMLDYDDGAVSKFFLDEFSLDEGSAFVVQCRDRTTKRGALMSTVVFANADRQLASAVIFPKSMGRLRHKVSEGKVVNPSVKKLDDGGLMLLGA